MIKLLEIVEILDKLNTERLLANFLVLEIQGAW